MANDENLKKGDSKAQKRSAAEQQEIDFWIDAVGKKNLNKKYLTYTKKNGSKRKIIPIVVDKDFKGNDVFFLTKKDQRLIKEMDETVAVKFGNKYFELTRNNNKN